MIYIACPSNCFTGGPTLLHQLCRELNDVGFPALMAYYEGVGSAPGPCVHPRYKGYRCGFVSLEDVNDCSGNWLILPETGTRFAVRYEHVRIVIWWLSVDNYILGNLGLFDKVRAHLARETDASHFIHVDTLKKRREFSSERYFHFSQSQYAMQFLGKVGVSEDRIRYLSDYVDDSFLADSAGEEQVCKEDMILYNPKKMGRLTRLLLDTRLGQYAVPLQGMSQEDLASVMRKAKLYLDFGAHPGKDRLPRETAICGCCVITGLRGSAGNDQDVSIPYAYKIPDDAEIDELTTVVERALHDYGEVRKDFDDYRRFIRSEHNAFKADLKLVCRTLFAEGSFSGQ